VFRHEGPARSTRKNAQLAGYLALIAGFVNSGGFILIGSFTSHVTGSVGRLSHDLALGEPSAAFFAFLLVITFFAGAFGASLILESRSGQLPRAYGVALLVEAILLASFVFVAGLSRTSHPRALDAQAAILSLAMGMQNSLVTRLSGAVVRTTHLTGVLTDLGIEAARWYRWYRQRLHLPMLGRPPERPESARAILLLTITGAFVVGAVLGALLTLRASRWAMGAPAAATVLAALMAFRTKTEN
jgi:uncharacterized membrane protein YoaK (UPF0700 family)